VANRISRRLRPVLVGLAALGAAALLVPTAATAAPADPASPPTVASVQQQLGTLALQNTMLVEQFDQAQVDVQVKQKAADSARVAANKSAAVYAKIRTQLSQTVAAQYEGGSFSATGALLSSVDGQSYLDQLNTLSVMSSHTAQMIARANAARTDLASADHHAKALLASATAKRNALAKRRDNVQKQIDKYTALLATLTAAQRDAFQASLTPPVDPNAVSTATSTLPSVSGVSGPAKKAVEFALAQVGKPYVFGAAGPDSYDCSGLTMAAWATAGVSLPHSAADQYNYGTHVGINQLQPGDLVFLYQPIGHVEIYIGSGMLVSAPQSGQDVSVVALKDYASDFTGATRLS
jgi:cell wall-associated NlpC family hydrolase